MKAIVDLHPDDTDLREHLRAQLVQARRDHGYSQERLARLIDWDQASLSHAERRTGWSLLILLRWAGALDLAAEFTIIGATPSPPSDRDRLPGHDWHITRFLRHAAHARQELGLRQVDAAELAGTTKQVWQDWESGGTNPKLATCQRNLRAIGRPLLLELTPRRAVVAA